MAYELRRHFGSKLSYKPQARATQMAKERDTRIAIPALGEWYEDLLRADAAINNRTPGQQFQSLGCTKLQERESKIMARVEYLAQKRGITKEEMWKQLVTGAHKKISPEEWAEMKTQVEPE